MEIKDGIGALDGVKGETPIHPRVKTKANDRVRVKVKVNEVPSAAPSAWWQAKLESA